ncbi:MAG: hypothetical protein VB067_03045 [Christensenellaceae bacterium]|nr:hypothetical protein [Christensenellaceae bacterium]MEA5067940.1 hypothetical protein [Christensenellaceae bacterium]
MSPDKAQQIGNDLACLAASIAEIAEEIKAMYDFDHDRKDDDRQPSPPASEPQQMKREQPNPPSLEEVRAFLAEKSRAGHTAAIREILLKHGSNKLSEVDPADYAAVLAEAKVLE